MTHRWAGTARSLVLSLGLVVVAVGLVWIALAVAGDGSTPPADPPTSFRPDEPTGISEQDEGSGSGQDPDATITEPEDAVPPAPDDADDVGVISPPADAARGRLTIHHVGDVNLDPEYVPILRDAGPEAAWDGVRDTFARADLVMVNLECVAAEGGTPQPKQFLFRCDLDALPAMRDAGVDVVTLANNHSGDYGIEAMVASRSNIEAAGMEAVGVGRDEADAYAPRIVEVGGWRVAIVGFGGVVPVPEWTARGDQPGQPTGYDPQRMAEAVRVAAQDADVVIATVHWGEEGSFEPRQEDRTKAAAMIEAGASVVFGHHAHRLQPLEIVDGVPVFWNLGNFVWPRQSPPSATTAVAEYVIEPDGTVSACLLPFEIGADGVGRPTGAARDCR